MGSGKWDATTYASTVGTARAAGMSAMTHTASGATSTHETLDPKGVDARESRDSADHPTSVAIAVLCDVTGSMGAVPEQIMDGEKLGRLMTLLLTKGYVEHPQVMFGAVGDAKSDYAGALQIGQFESDNRVDDTLSNLWLTRGGGGTREESYELAAYFMARHTSIDCYEKRGERGYLFFIGDEKPYGKIDPKDVTKYIGDNLQDVIKTGDIFADLTKMYDCYYLMPMGSSYYSQAQYRDEHLNVWRGLVGPQNVILVPNIDTMAETIATTIGLAEGTVDLEDAEDHLRDVGASEDEIKSVTTALAHKDNASLVTSIAPDDLDDDGDENIRL